MRVGSALAVIVGAVIGPDALGATAHEARRGLAPGTGGAGHGVQVAGRGVQAAGTERRIERVTRGLRLPLEVRGRDARGLDLEARMRHHRVPAVSIAVIEGGAVDWARAWGAADVDSGRAATSETLFQAASISKPVAALAALRLVEDGRLELDRDVERALPGWSIPRGRGAGSEPVTLRRLLTHSGGLTVHGYSGYPAGVPVPTTREVLEGAGAANSPPVLVDVPPGSAWRYSGGGYTVIQLLVEEATGRSFSDAIRGILDQLGMKGSTYEQPLPDSLELRASTGYRASGRAVAGRWHTYPEMAAAGLWTTPSDLARYALAVSGWLQGVGGVLSRTMTARMLTPGIGGWGLGPALEGDGLDLRFSHEGANEGFRSRFVMFPRRGIGAVVMTNSDAGMALADEVMFAISDAYDWPAVKPRQIEALALDRGRALEFAGRYAVDDAPDVRVAIDWRRGRLELSVSGRLPAELVRVGADRFVNLADGETISFERDERGRVEAVIAYGSRARRQHPVPA